MFYSRPHRFSITGQQRIGSFANVFTEGPGKASARNYKRAPFGEKKIRGRERRRLARWKKPVPGGNAPTSPPKAGKRRGLLSKIKSEIQISGRPNNWRLGRAQGKQLHSPRWIIPRFRAESQAVFLRENKRSPEPFGWSISPMPSRHDPSGPYLFYCKLKRTVFVFGSFPEMLVQGFQGTRGMFSIVPFAGTAPPRALRARKPEGPAPRKRNCWPANEKKEWARGAHSCSSILGAAATILSAAVATILRQNGVKPENCHPFFERYSHVMHSRFLPACGGPLARRRSMLDPGG